MIERKSYLLGVVVATMGTALGVALTPTVIADTVAPQVETCFEPGGGCAITAVAVLEAARAHVLVHAYALTTGPVAAALARAAARGVPVQLVVDRQVPCERGSGLPAIVTAGAQTRVDDKVHFAHEKAIIVDGAVVVAGSYNWTGDAARNSEDLIVIRSPAVATVFAAHWAARWNVSAPYVPVACPIAHARRRH